MSKNLLIILDQGLGDNIHFSKTLDVIAEKFFDRKIFLMGTKGALQVFEDHKYIYDYHTINYKKNIFKTYIDIKSAKKFIENNDIKEFYSLYFKHKSILHAFIASVIRPFYLRRWVYHTFLLYFTKMHQITDNAPKTHTFHYECLKKHQRLFYNFVNAFPSKFVNEDFSDPNFTKPKLVAKNPVAFKNNTIGIHPGTSKKRRYPIEYYSDVAFKIANLNKSDIILFSGNDLEDKINKKIIKRLISLNFDSKRINVLPRMNFQNLCNHIASLNLLICNDSGPMHVASALDVPIIAYPAPFKKDIEHKWIPESKCISLTRKDLNITDSSFIRMLYKTFKYRPRPQNIHLVVENIFQKYLTSEINTFSSKD